MKLTIDEKECLKHKITLEECLIALSFHRVKDHTAVVNNLLQRDILYHKDGELYVTQHWSDILNEIIADSSNATDEERLKSLAKEMQKCFPEGKIHGTAYYYRCNVREVTLKLKKFFLQYGDYTDEEIINATKRFVASFHGNYRFLPLIKYFILKNKTVMDEDGQRHVVEVSELASYLENQDNEDTVVTNSDDWLLSSRN